MKNVFLVLLLVSLVFINSSLIAKPNYRIIIKLRNNVVTGAGERILIFKTFF